jgi:hypothetical protein
MANTDASEPPRSKPGAGVNVRVAMAPDGMDFNDLLLTPSRAERIVEIIKNAGPLPPLETAFPGYSPNVDASAYPTFLC